MNKMEGNGIINWADGKQFIGEFRNDLKHGKGTFIWPDGRKYFGTWDNGLQ